MKTFIVIVILFSAICVFAQMDDKAKLKELSQKVVDLVEAAKYDNALKFAEQSLALTIKIYGAENSETAIAYSNLGIIHRKRMKYSDSTENLSRAIAIAEKLPDSKELNRLILYEALALSQYLDGKNKEALDTQIIGTNYAEVTYGEGSKENLISIINLANLYGRTEKFDEADQLYLKGIGLILRKEGRKAPDLETIDDSRVCISPNLESETLKRNKLFKVKETALYAEIFGSVLTDNTGTRILNVGDVNGKALSLPRPIYPLEARNRRLSGKFPIRVVINESGDVIEAKSICRGGSLAESSQNAALSAKFSPTIVAGKPAKVRGIITYNFVAQ